MRTLLRPARFVFGALVALAPVAALAHPGHDGGHEIIWDFTGGFAHPFSGWDHLLAMVAVGLWAAQLGGRARWLVPAAFVGTMTLTAWVGQLGLHVPALEPAIAVSVLLLGLLLAAAVRLPVALGATLVAIFASFHGLAHGAEVPASAHGLTYGAGFVLATLLLHALGLGAGSVAGNRVALRSMRAAGWLIAAAGAALLVA